MYEGLMNYLEQCPHLEGGIFHFDFLSSEPITYTVAVPVNLPDLSQDIMGNNKRQLNFYIIATQHFGDDNKNNITNLELFQKVKKWFEKQNSKRIFPDLGEGITVTRVYATTDGFVDATDEQIGRYQIQCKVEYTQANTSPKKAPLRF